MQGALLRALVGGSVAAAVWIGVTVALDAFTILQALAFGVFMAVVFAALPALVRAARSERSYWRKGRH